MSGTENVHSGHRGRMKEKLVSFGDRIFHTYELLEMLLYYVIPYKDTNPISKALLKRFSGIDGVLSASYDELLAIEGVGPKAAELIYAVGRVNPYDEDKGKRRESFSRLESFGEYFVKLFRGAKTQAVYLALLDNKGELIDTVKICESDYSLGTVRSELFIDKILKSGATFAVVAHNHPYGPLIPSEGDLATNSMIVNDARRAGTPIGEHFIVSGDSYLGFMNNVRGTVANEEASPLKEFEEDALSDIKGLLSYACKDREATRSFLKKYNTKSKISCATEAEVLRHFEGDMSTFVFIKLLFSLKSRCVTDTYKALKMYSEEEIKRYLSSLFLPLSVETLYLISFDGFGRLLSVDLVSEGSVGTLSIAPRRLLDIASKRDASSVIIAHNHPGGFATPSEDDRAGTQVVSDALSASGIKLLAHYVVAGNNVNCVSTVTSLYLEEK